MTSHLKVLIVDVSHASIDLVVRALINNGLKRSNIFSASDYRSALHLIDKIEPDFLITEFYIEGNRGLDLIKRLNLQNANKVSMILTANNSRSAISEAAEELVDDYVIKPLVLQNFVSRIQNLLVKKLNPPAYMEQIRNGKQMILENRLSDASICFEKASLLDSKPSLAFYYLGFVNFLEKNFDNAKESFENGLQVRPLHFKCLTGQFDNFFEQGRYAEAYQLAPRLVENYPLSAKRLCDLFKAAVYSGHLDEVDKYYNFFLQMEDVTPELRQVFSAALLVAGKYHLKKKTIEKALFCFDSSLQVIGSDLKYVEEIVKSLVGEGYGASLHVKKYLLLIPSEKYGGAEHARLVFLIDQFRKTPHELIEQGRRLVRDGFADSDCFRLLIKILIQEKKQTLAEDYLIRASKIYPEIRKEFSV